MTEIETDLEDEAEAGYVREGDVVGRWGVLTPARALDLGHGLVALGYGPASAGMIASAYGADLADVCQLVPVTARPAWDYGTSGGPTPWPLGTRSGAVAVFAEIIGDVEVANSIVPLALPPEALVKMKAKAVARGWVCLVLWGQAQLPVRALVKPVDGEEKGHFETSLVDTLSVSLRMGREGRRAYGVWSSPVAQGSTWGYVTGGVDGRAGVKVTALGKALE